jgi:hypothetical protein
MMPAIQVGEIAGHHFHGNADLELVRHVTAGDRRGFLHGRKRLVDRVAFAYDPRLGWETDRWIEWDDEGD